MVRCYSYENADWSNIPRHMVGDMKRYIEDGMCPGGFLTSVLENDLRGSVSRADDVNRYHLLDFVQFLYSYAPSPCWGSPEIVSAWIKQGGLNGHEEHNDRGENEGNQSKALLN